MQLGGEARQIQKIPAVANSREEKYKMLRQYRIILSADTASEVPQLPERCLSRKAGIVRCCLKTAPYRARYHVYQTEKRPVEQPALWPPQRNAANA